VSEPLHPHRAWRELHEAFFDAWFFVNRAMEVPTEQGQVVDPDEALNHLGSVVDALAAVGDFVAPDFDWSPFGNIEPTPPPHRSCPTCGQPRSTVTLFEASLPAKPAASDGGVTTRD
jgi:hypothetical protein